MNIYALHGFLGLPEDWKIINSQWRAVSIFECGGAMTEMDGWAEAFNHYIEESAILIGYSLGGRLALHALLQNPSKWAAAVLISTHPGLYANEERVKRIKEDQAWANAFLNDPWEEVIDRWNQQPVFAHDRAMSERKEIQFSRTQLAHCLNRWGLGQQDNLRDQLANLDLPILWVVGAHDAKQVSIAKELTFKNAHSQVKVIPDVGHRVPWANKHAFTKAVEEFSQFIT